MCSTKKAKKIKILSLFVLACFISTTGASCQVFKQQDASTLPKITLEYWRTFDNQDNFDEIIKDYQKLHPNVTINYRKFRYEEYESELLNALAEDRGPDIYSIPEEWLRKYQPKILPMPASLTLNYAVEKVYFGIKRETVIESRTEKTPTILEIKNKYADTVGNDLVINDKLYGLPLYLDSLAMFYNKDILNQAGISTPPTDWKTFQDDVAKTTKYESDNKIIQSGTALGTGFNVERSFDILSLLMMQSGAVMANSQGTPTFFGEITKAGSKFNPGLTALQFYSDFANPVKNVYCWNNTMPNSFQAFAAGTVAFFFGYNYQIPQIRSQSRVNFAIAPVPQIAGNPIRNYANYWVETVSAKTKNPNTSWDFLLFMNKPAEVAKYLAKTNYPTAQRGLIASQAGNGDIDAFGQQTLTAATWYQGVDSAAAEQGFKELIEKFLVATDDRAISDLMNYYTQYVLQTIKPKSSK